MTTRQGRRARHRRHKRRAADRKHLTLRPVIPMGQASWPGDESRGLPGFFDPHWHPYDEFMARMGRLLRDRDPFAEGDSGE